MTNWIISIGTILTVLLWVGSLTYFIKTLRSSAEKKDQVRKKLQVHFMTSSMLLWIRPPMDGVSEAKKNEMKQRFRRAVRWMAIQLAAIAVFFTLVGLVTIPAMPDPYVSLLILGIVTPLIGLYACYFFFLLKLLGNDMDKP
jgi:FtsH-binding integral membrane protein